MANPTFEPGTLEQLDRLKEVRIETTRPDGTVRSTIIWAIVDDGEVFVRSWKGDRGQWYQAALDAPDDVALVYDDTRIPVRAVLTTDQQSIERCSAGLLRKYKRSASLDSMVQPYNLGTTLRIEPR